MFFFETCINMTLRVVFLQDQNSKPYAKTTSYSNLIYTDLSLTLAASLIHSSNRTEPLIFPNNSFYQQWKNQSKAMKSQNSEILDAITANSVASVDPKKP